MREEAVDYPETTGLRLIPAPAVWLSTKQDKVTIGLSSDDSQVLAVDILARRLGLRPLVQAGGVPVRVENLPGGAEGGYGLEIAPDQITSERRTTQGGFMPPSPC